MGRRLGCAARQPEQEDTDQHEDCQGDKNGTGRDCLGRRGRRRRRPLRRLARRRGRRRAEASVELVVPTTLHWALLRPAGMRRAPSGVAPQLDRATIQAMQERSPSGIGHGRKPVR
jgi:hypothetical protein